MHSAATGHLRQKVAPSQRDLAWIAELKIETKNERQSESPWRESGHQVLGR